MATMNLTNQIHRLISDKSHVPRQEKCHASKEDEFSSLIACDMGYATKNYSIPSPNN